MRKPDFNNLLKVLKRDAPDRPTLFEFFLNQRLYQKLAQTEDNPAWHSLEWSRMCIRAYTNAGYDYVTLQGSDFFFPRKEVEIKASRSMNETALIFDRASFEEYPWPDPDSYDYSKLEILKDDLPAGMKIIIHGPGGVLENVLSLTGYENLCFLLLDDPALVQDIFDAVGSRLNRYYEICAAYDTVGALISNDDWGFNTQTMLSPDDMRKYVIPWHIEIVKTIHQSGKPAILHSCGKLDAVMDDIIDVIGYDGKHSFEDKIQPVEEAYEALHDRIAILGGIDLDFICRSTPKEVYDRSKAMLERSAERGAYALGTGNSVPEYVPDENYLAMISAATDIDYSSFLT